MVGWGGGEMWEVASRDQSGNGDVRGKEGPAEPRDAAEWGREHLGFEPDRGQALVLGSASKRGLLNCTRQWGKSTIAAAKAVHHAYTEPKSLTLVVSPSARQSGEFVRKAAGFARLLGIRVKGDGDNSDLAGIPEPIADRGTAGERGHRAGILGGVATAGGRGFAGERRPLQDDPADAGG